jgi:hypothetical protein
VFFSLIQSRRRDSALACLVAMLLFLANSCATTSPPTAETRAQLGRVGVLALASSPKGDFHTFAKGRGVGVAKGGALGGGEGLLYGLAAASRGAASDPYAGAAILLGGLIFMLVGATVGVVAGAVKAVPAETAESIERQIDKTLDTMNLSVNLAAAVCDARMSRPDLKNCSIANLGSVKPGDALPFCEYARDDISTIVQIEVTDAGFQGGTGKRPSIAFYMQARVRIMNTAAGDTLYTRDFRYLSEERMFREWVGDDAKQLAGGFRDAQKDLADRILDELFLVTEFPFDSGQRAFPGQDHYGICWLKPIYPEHRTRSFRSLFLKSADEMRRDMILYSQVDSLQPTLRWEPFPRPRDRKPKNESLLSRIKDVTYDLKVWQASNDYPQRLVCDVTGLPEPQYRLPYPLKPGTKYFWTFRVRYTLGGQPQVSRWAFSLAPATGEGMRRGGSCDMDEIPSTNYFRFVAP